MTADFDAPQIVEAPERRVVGLSQEFTVEARHRIPELWMALWRHDFGLPGLDRTRAFGVSCSARPDGSFSYAAGFEMPDEDVKPRGGCVVHLAGGTYARFAQRVEMKDIPVLFDAAFSQWLPNSGQTQREGAVFEYYPPDPEATETSRLFELWIPIA